MNNQEQRWAREAMKLLYGRIPDLYNLSPAALIQRLLDMRLMLPTVVTRDLPATTPELVERIQRVAQVITPEELRSLRANSKDWSSFGYNLCHMRDSGQVSVEVAAALGNAKSVEQLFNQLHHQTEDKSAHQRQ